MSATTAMPTLAACLAPLDLAALQAALTPEALVELERQTAGMAMRPAGGIAGVWSGSGHVALVFGLPHEQRWAMALFSAADAHDGVLFAGSFVRTLNEVRRRGGVGVADAPPDLQ